jgi:hypothetical protein
MSAAAFDIVDVDVDRMASPISDNGDDDGAAEALPEADCEVQADGSEHVCIDTRTEEMKEGDEKEESKADITGTGTADILDIVLPPLLPPEMAPSLSEVLRFMLFFYGAYVCMCVL